MLMKLQRKRRRRKDGPSHRIFKPIRSRAPKYRARRMFILGTFIVTLLFLAKILLSFFDFEHVQVSVALFGNSHYTEGEIYNVLGENLDNIVTDSEAQTVAYLKENLSYIKDAYVSRSFVKRQLTIEITERQPFARVKHLFLKESKLKKESQKTTGRKSTDGFFLIDGAGYVLESITPEKYHHMTIVLDEGVQEPEVGKQIKTDTTQLGIHILKLAKSKEPELAKYLKTIDARVPQKIKINVESLPMSVWITADLIETGLHHVGLFVQQRGLLILQRERQMKKVKTLTKTRVGKKDFLLPENFTYLDARYEDTLYLGGEGR